MFIVPFNFLSYSFIFATPLPAFTPSHLQPIVHRVARVSFKSTFQNMSLWCLQSSDDFHQYWNEVLRPYCSLKCSQGFIPSPSHRASLLWLSPLFSVLWPHGLLLTCTHSHQSLQKLLPKPGVPFPNPSSPPLDVPGTITGLQPHIPFYLEVGFSLLRNISGLHFSRKIIKSKSKGWDPCTALEVALFQWREERARLEI